MKTYHSIFDFKTSKKTILTLGTFDGVHLGHKSILDKLKKGTEKGRYESVVLTFFPHPRMVLNQDSSIKLLNTIDEKTILLENFGIDTLIIHPFDAAFSNLTAEDFVKDILVDQLNIQKIIIGYDHRFGKNRTADINDLIAFGEKYGFEVAQIGAKEIDEIAISSTKIRKALLGGDIKLTNQYLGYSYFISGKVVEGKKIGRTIGFPTANIKLSETYKLLPKNGVYIVSCKINDTLFYGMMNIGNNPTIGDNEQSIEVHFFELNQDIYNHNLQISILKHIREEQKFNSIEELKSQLENDKALSIAFIKTII
ncbi:MULTISPECIES: bifunctional riboflavin kinase/FAD synthetase [unclassified Flavobacterium]|uniref:bifunctional riboflavin kinase/FAD synthetase n=1 Tax=unclassified Flavobacterium TaxID=196869 RepID=UPI0012925BA9|nr:MULTISPECIES: bifunctional riboflavin kinase/FAD synthetase [unclassified Flavobacterium]MQP53699.1 bifunctional riboflavin kinase/FAD synthetase [Flavobacterium sp. LMO9]MQP63323.1 bifunctional riboflavin kinase/FAD synthetase [Flavobacterium sp. LMO6]